MTWTVAEIAAAIGGKAVGAVDISVSAVAEPQNAGASDLVLALSPAYAEALAASAARAAVLGPETDWETLGLKAAIVIKGGRYAMSDLTAFMDTGPDIAPGIDPSAIIDPTAQIGEAASIGPMVVVGAKVRIGANARIGSHVSIGRGTHIGSDALIHPGVRIAHDVSIGNGFIVQSGTVIGSDGFSFVPAEGIDIDGARRSLGADYAPPPPGPAVWRRTHSLGGVEIADDVEIGANATIDRGTIRSTRIGRGTKLDNLVHIAHNVVVGEDTLLCAGVGIAGSTVIGSRCVLAGQVGVNDNITVGDDVVAAGATKIYSSQPAGRILMGSPATKMQTQIETYKALRRLPRLFKDVAKLRKALAKGSKEP